MDAKQKLIDISIGQFVNLKKYGKKWELNAQEIFNILRLYSTYSVSRFKIIGSIGVRSPKGTFYQSDFDLVLFVNFKSPPFTEVLSDFERVLQEHCGRKNHIVFESRTSNSSQFLMRDASISNEVAYISFDLLPALNLLSLEEEKLAEENREQIQARRALQLIHELPDPKKNSVCSYNSSLAESYVSFVRDQSSFVQDVIRLAKLWNRMVVWDGREKLHGRSMMIEIVAVSVACAEELDAENGGRNESILLAFRMFLNKFIYFDRLMFELFKYSTTNQKYLKDMPCTERPIILDPVNPFNNLADSVTSEMKVAFESHAHATLNAIHNSVKFGGKCGNTCSSIESCFGL